MKGSGDLAAFQRAQGKWADAQFPGQTVVSKLKHLRKEINELIDKPSDVSEMADCMSLLLDAARKQGHTVETLTRACWEKLEINKAREWGQPDADGVCEHVRKEA